MMPVTLNQLDSLADIREHKENLESAANATDEILDDMLEMMGDMSQDCLLYTSCQRALTRLSRWPGFWK